MATQTKAVTGKPEFIKGNDLSKSVGVSLRTIRRLQAAKQIPFYRLGKLVLFRKDEVLATMAKFRVASISE